MWLHTHTQTNKLTTLQSGQTTCLMGVYYAFSGRLQSLSFFHDCSAWFKYSSVRIWRMIMIFVSGTADNQCKVSIHSPRTGTDVQRNSCSQYKLDGSWNTTVFSTDRFTSTIVSEVGLSFCTLCTFIVTSDISEICLLTWMIVFSPALLQWDLVCNNAYSL